jgi:AsmA protein
LTAAKGIKRLGLAVVAAVAAAFCALVALSIFMPAETVREAVKAEIKAVTGLEPTLRGQVSVSLFPTGSITFDDVSLGDNRTGAPALTAEQVVARLRFLPFLAGRIEVADISLVRPKINVSFGSDGRTNWSGHFETLGRALTPESQNAQAFSEIRITDGTVVFSDETGAPIETLTNIDLALAWPSISRSFAATGRFVWHNEKVDATVSLSDFVGALAGRRSGLKLRLAGEPLKFSFDGYISHRPTLKLEGNLATDAPSLRQVLTWTGLQPLPGGGFGRFALKAKTNVANGTIELSNVNLELDGNVGEGSLAFATDGRKTLQGTLATDQFNLTPYVSTIRLLTGGARDWSRWPIVLDGLDGIDMDLRLSAQRVTVGTTKVGRTAVVTNLRGGKLTVTVGESQAFGGLLTGSFTLAKATEGAAMKAQLTFANVDLDQALGELFGLRRLEGKGNLALNIEATGATVYDITKALNGSASLVSKKGSISGLNVEQLLRRVERRPLSSGNELRSGKTPYDLLTVSLKIKQGMAEVDDVRVEGPGLKLTVDGTASIPARSVDLRGTASLMPSGTSAAPAGPIYELPFIVFGPWDNAEPFLDPQILIQRSRAAAPLLKAIQGLTNPPAGAPPPAQPAAKPQQ